jgi:signal transduction histidine kinase
VVGRHAGFARSRAASVMARQEESLRGATELIYRLKQEQRALEVAKQNFLDAVSHELRTPLTGMTAALEIIGQEAAAQPALMEWVGILQQSTARLTGIVERIEEMVQLDTAHAQTRFQIVSLDEVLATLEARLSSRCQERGVVCTFERPDLPIGVAAGPEYVVRLLELLVENAIQFSPENEEVRIHCQPLLDCGEEDRIYFEVLDRGPSIPDEQLGRVFDTFCQARSEGEGRLRGLGLGLSTCRSLAAALGTKLSARRRHGGGAAFRFDLPCFFRSAEERLQASRAVPRTIDRARPAPPPVPVA